jgi:hypothetical protein
MSFNYYKNVTTDSPLLSTDLSIHGGKDCTEQTMCLSKRCVCSVSSAKAVLSASNV